MLHLKHIQRLNCKTDYFNTVNMVWGSSESEIATGIFGELKDDLTDIVTGNLVAHNRMRV